VRGRVAGFDRGFAFAGAAATTTFSSLSASFSSSQASASVLKLHGVERVRAHTVNLPND
jgi:hypothetical protein